MKKLFLPTIYIAAFFMLSGCGEGDYEIQKYEILIELEEPIIKSNDSKLPELFLKLYKLNSYNGKTFYPELHFKRIDLDSTVIVEYNVDNLSKVKRLQGFDYDDLEADYDDKSNWEFDIPKMLFSPKDTSRQRTIDKVEGAEIFEYSNENSDSILRIIETLFTTGKLLNSKRIVLRFVTDKTQAEGRIELEIPEKIDTDKDGITNDKDQCPTVAGSKENYGCPKPPTPPPPPPGFNCSQINQLTLDWSSNAELGGLLTCNLPIKTDKFAVYCQVSRTSNFTNGQIWNFPVNNLQFGRSNADINSLYSIPSSYGKLYFRFKAVCNIDNNYIMYSGIKGPLQIVCLVGGRSCKLMELK